MSHTPRRLVLCLDGTWNHTYQLSRREDGSEVVKPSNVLKVARAVLPEDSAGRPQVVYYDIGVGSLARYPGLSNKLLAKSDNLLGGAWGAGFEGNVEDALHFLALNYRVGDEVMLFGFSRGASTARAVTQFLSWSGGLPAEGDEYYLPEVFRAYVASKAARTREDVVAEINRGKAERHRARGKEGEAAQLGPFRPVPVAYLGVWDTVMALGSRFKSKGKTTTGEASRSFHVRSTVPSAVQRARHALAVDEVRYDFRPEIWTECGSDQAMEQRWFAGVHSNVGGGYPDDGVANCALKWIGQGAEEAGLALRSLTRFYRAYPQDRLYRSDKLFYRILDSARRRAGRGRRELVGQPSTANLTLDKSVIHRIISDPEERDSKGELEFPEMKGKPYRPDNVLRFLAAQPDLDAYLAAIEDLKPEHQKLPEDVVTRIEELRAER